MNPIAPESRVAVIAHLARASHAANRTLGRTQLMKLAYFLQELKGAALGYDFRLFNFGPFDSEVLSDLASACGVGAVVETSYLSAGGYGYSIKPGSAAETLASKLATHEPELVACADEVAREFGSYSAAELELRSTILFVDREWDAFGFQKSTNELVARVREIKPHFTEPIILARIEHMKQSGWLRSVASQQPTTAA